MFSLIYWWIVFCDGDAPKSHLSTGLTSAAELRQQAHSCTHVLYIMHLHHVTQNDFAVMDYHEIWMLKSGSNEKNCSSSVLNRPISRIHNPYSPGNWIWWLLNQDLWCGAQKWMTNLVCYDLLEWIVVFGGSDSWQKGWSLIQTRMRCDAKWMVSLEMMEMISPAYLPFFSACARVKLMNLRKLTTEALQLLMRIRNDDRRAIIIANVYNSPIIHFDWRKAYPTLDDSITLSWSLFNCVCALLRMHEHLQPYWVRLSLSLIRQWNLHTL